MLESYPESYPTDRVHPALEQDRRGHSSPTFLKRTIKFPNYYHTVLRIKTVSLFIPVHVVDLKQPFNHLKTIENSSIENSPNHFSLTCSTLQNFQNSSGNQKKISLKLTLTPTRSSDWVKGPPSIDRHRLERSSLALPRDLDLEREI